MEYCDGTSGGNGDAKALKNQEPFFFFFLISILSNGRYAHLRGVSFTSGMEYCAGTAGGNGDMEVHRDQFQVEKIWSRKENCIYHDFQEIKLLNMPVTRKEI